MRRVYVSLLRLYPNDYREIFAAEMLAAFEEASEERRRHGSLVFLRFTFVELMGLVGGAGAEWMAKSTYSLYHSNSSYIRGRCLPDLRKMWPASAAREAYYAAQTAHANLTTLIAESEMCINAHQRFIYASPLKRLLILICEMFLPIHPRMGAKTRVWSRHG